MKINIQIPVLDCRRILTPSLINPLPAWPIPKPGKEYFHGHGMIEEKKFDSPSIKYAETNKCVIRKSIVLRKHIKYNNKPIAILNKCFYDDGNGMCKYEFDFFYNEDKDLQIEELINHILTNVKFTINNKLKESFRLVNAEDKLRQHYLNSTKINNAINNQECVIFGIPQVLVSIHEFKNKISHKKFTNIQKSNEIQLKDDSWVYNYTQNILYKKLYKTKQQKRPIIINKIKNIPITIFSISNEKEKKFSYSFIDIFQVYSYKSECLKNLYNFFVYKNIDFNKYESIIRESFSFICLSNTITKINFFSYLEFVEFMLNPNWRVDLIKVLKCKIRDNQKIINKIDDIENYLSSNGIAQLKSYHHDFVINNAKTKTKTVITEFLNELPKTFPGIFQKMIGF